MKTRLLFLGLMTTCAASALAAAAFADPPGRVGRISYVEGEVSFQPPQENFWSEASRNYPVAQGEAFWTGDSGRAEIQIGAMEGWLDSQTELDVVDLDYGETRLSLAQGSLELRVWRVPRGGISISTPAGDVRIDYAGLYRIDVGAPRQDGYYPDVEVTTFDGAAGAPGPYGLMTVGAGQAVYVQPGYQPEAADLDYVALDDWAHERQDRERWDWREDVSPAMTGGEELGRYGDFQADAQYGQVWFPRDVPADWAPYRYGHWAYVQPWGWTWIDDQPWGFAPFHYGRWAQVGGRWGWIPGQVAAEPVYAPALVAFVGGSGWNIGVSIGGGGGGAMGWVPLAPGEVFRPAYQVSNTYIRQVNVTNVSRTTINNITVNNTTVNNVTVNNYRNAQAAVVVRQDAFARGAPVQKAAVAVPVAALASAPVTPVVARIAPTPEARAAVVAKPGAPPVASVAALQTVARAAPPPPKLQAIRTAVVAAPQGAVKPPPIAGAQVAAPHAPGAPHPAAVAPAQAANPAQIRRAPPSATQPAPATAQAHPPGQPPAATAQQRPAGPPPAATAPGSTAAQAPAAAQARAAAQAQAQAQQQQQAAERQRAAQATAQAQAQQQAAERAQQAQQQKAAQAAAQAQAQQQAAERAQQAAQQQKAAQAAAQAQAQQQAAERAQQAAQQQKAAQAAAQAQAQQQAAERAQQRAAQAAAQAQAQQQAADQARQRAADAAAQQRAAAARAQADAQARAQADAAARARADQEARARADAQARPPAKPADKSKEEDKKKQQEPPQR